MRKEKTIKRKLSFKARNKGITLIALVITIIILIILASITLGAIIGPNGLIRRAEEAGKNYQIAAKEEEKELEKLMNGMDGTYEDDPEDNEPASEDIYVSLKGNTLSFYNNEETAKTNADSEAHYYGNVKGFTDAPWESEKEIIERVKIVNKIIKKISSCDCLFCKY